MRDLSSFFLVLAAVLRPCAACPEDYVECASEGGTCTFDGQRSVAYGEQGTYVYQTADGSIGCDSGVFGDPLGGVTKKCCYADPNEGMLTIFLDWNHWIFGFHSPPSCSP